MAGRLIQPGTEPGRVGLPAPHETRKAVVAAAIGNVLEWYDFGVYVFFAGVIARNSFRPRTRRRRCCRRSACSAWGS